MKKINNSKMASIQGGAGSPTKCFIAGIMVFSALFGPAVHYIATECD
ncbi:MAG: hypothetical protein HC854_06825 [Flavobacterium sp.]|nr:hypothetical protein [Flavobacterium sp.]